MLKLCLSPTNTGHGTLEFQEDFTHPAEPNTLSVHMYTHQEMWNVFSHK